MATRVNKKNVATTSPKEVVTAEKAPAKNDNVDSVQKSSGTSKSIGKRIVKRVTKKIVKKPLGIKLKAKVQKLKLNPLAKDIIKSKNKKILKSCLKETKPRKRTIPIKKEVEIKREPEDNPPVLEPIFPLEENKKQPRKRKPKKKTDIPELLDIKIKEEIEDDPTLTDLIDLPNLTKQIKKPKIMKKPDTVDDTIEKVINDLTYLIKTEDIKNEVDTSSEPTKTESKPKKITKKQKLDLLKKQITSLKNEDIENNISKFDSAEEKLIDMLDLNVNMLKKKSPVTKRRHSFEKCPINSIESDNINVFAHLPRSISPRAKRKGKGSVSRKSSPYSTRSDSPARILRNGKHRKLKDLGLLEGLDLEIRKRRRVCSDSGSKLSGYESDSSFSIASSIGAESNEATKDDDKDVKPIINTASNGPIENLIDSNSNIFSANSIAETNDDSNSIPEKNVLLDIMKQTFNNEVELKKDKFKVGTMITSRFYGRHSAGTPEDKTETILKEEKEKIADEAPVMEDDVNFSSALQKVDSEEFTETNDNSQNSLENLTDVSLNTKEESEINETTTSNAVSDKEEPMEEELDVINLVPQEVQLQTTENIECESDKMDAESAVGDEVHTDVTESVDNCVVDNVISNANEVDSTPAETESPVIEDQIQIAGPSSTENISAVIENNEEDFVDVEELDDKILEKESILKALGLQRSKNSKQKTKEKVNSVMSNGYTGTLKTVIKINRDKKKGGRSTAKSSIQKSKTKCNVNSEEETPVVEEVKDKANKDKDTSHKHGTSMDTAGAHRKSHYSNRSNMADGSSEHTSDGESAPQDGAIKALVIPEKASSFSIHPGRLCKDECSYCFGKFGLFDTPCHIAQMKSVDRQNKILASEKHLTRDSCLCDACYRHVDRKSNTPSYMNRSLKRNSLVAPGPRQNHCHVLGCEKESTNILRRKWIIKMRKNICQVINLDLDNPGLHSIPICDEHYAALEHLMICAMCKRRLARNHIHYLGPETNELNKALSSNGIPLLLNDKPVVCKLCKYFASIILKDAEDRPETSNNFFKEYKKRLLHFNDIVPMDEASAEEPIAVPSKAERTDLNKKKKKSKSSASADEHQTEDEEPCSKREERISTDTNTNSQPQSRSESPSDDYNGVDYNTLIPAIAMEEESDHDNESKKETKTPTLIKKFNEMQREGVEIVKVSKNDKKQLPTIKKYSYGPSVSVRQLFPGEEDLPLLGKIDFDNVKERTPEGWEKCSTVIQYDDETKRLWQELQKPYGNQSSFLRHLILLEKYFRNGDLVLSPKASHHSINYSESVHNRLRAYDNIPTSAGNIQPLSMLPFNKMYNKSSSGIITGNNIPPAISSQSISIQSTTTTNSKLGATSSICLPNNISNLPKSTPITISQLNSPPLLPANSNSLLRPKIAGQPPGLISLHPGTTRPVAPLVKVSQPQPQKIKFPITKNWRPNLIPIDPTKKVERKTGLVQVISGGKPYHITLEDYKKMCAIKRSFEMKQKRLQEAQSPRPLYLSQNSVLKSIAPRKGLVISKTMKTESAQSDGGSMESENILEQLDKQVEKLESKLNEKPSMILPRIPKSLTVIPQTVTRKTDRPTSPVLLITSKNTNKS